MKQPQRPLYQIAAEIKHSWRPVSYYAKPYLEAMECLETVKDNYGSDSGKTIVAYFLSNAAQWTGETARAIKKELKEMIK